MITKELLDSVRQQLTTGMPESEVLKTCSSNGWAESDVREAILTLKQNTTVSPAPTQEQINPVDRKMGFFQKVFSVIVRPSSFFSDIKFETGYGKPIRYLIIIATVSLLAQFVSQLAGGGALAFLLLVPFIGLLTVGILMLIGFSFVQAGILHIVGKLFKISGPFINTYKAVVYGLTPYILIQSLSKLSFYDYLNPIGVSFSVVDLNIFSIWAIILIALGIAKQQGVTFKKALLAVITLIVILFIVSIPLLLSSGKLFKSLGSNLGIGANPEKISYDQICANVGEFMLPACAKSVAIYNNDSSICENISLTPSSNGGSHNPEYKQSCTDIIQTGAVRDKEFQMVGNISYGQAEAVAFENKCELTCKNASKNFISYDSDGANPWGKHSVNGYTSFDSEKKDSSVLIQTCSCF
jgi:hypothetical protein